jgi:DNA-binding NtrC family response regulator
MYQSDRDRSGARLLIVEDHEVVRQTPADLPDSAHDATGNALEYAWSAGWDLDRLEREYILHVLDALGGRRGEAATRLGIDRRTLYRKLNEYRIHAPDEDALLAGDAARGPELHR